MGVLVLTGSQNGEIYIMLAQAIRRLTTQRWSGSGGACCGIFKYFCEFM